MLRFIAFCSLLLLGACNTVTPYLNVYDGLLPAGYQVKESPDPVRADVLKARTAVLVTSTNFNNYTAKWQDYYEKGGSEQYKNSPLGAVASMAGDVDSGITKIRQASDPRNFVDRVYAELRPYFKSVKAAGDFAEARDLKADYIVLVDYYGTFNEMGDMYRTKGGLYMLDGNLRRVLQVEGNAEVIREEPGLFGGTSAVYAITARTYTKGLDATTNQILAGARAKLGAPAR